MKRNIQIEVKWRNHVRGNEDNPKCKYLSHERNDHVHYNCARSIFNASFSTFNVKFFMKFIFFFVPVYFFHFLLCFYFIRKWKLVHICKSFFYHKPRFFHHFFSSQFLFFFFYFVLFSATHILLAFTLLYAYILYTTRIFLYYSLLLYFWYCENFNDHHRHHTSIAQLIMMIFVLSKLNTSKLVEKFFFYSAFSLKKWVMWLSDVLICLGALSFLRKIISEFLFSFHIFLWNIFKLLFWLFSLINKAVMQWCGNHKLL